MPISRTEFNSKNTILFKTKLKSYSKLRGKPVDMSYVDMNKNDKLDMSWKRTGFSTARDIHDEPALSVSFDRIKEQLENMDQGEVATQSDLNSMQIKDVSVDYGTTVFTKTTINKTNTRALATLIDQLAPIGDNKGTAIDTNTGEFIIYSPKPES